MAEITSVKRAVCTKAPGADPAQKAAAKANCEANMERVDVKACSYGTSVARATSCVKRLVPSIFDAPTVTADDVVKKLGRGETPSAEELAKITPEYIKGLIANKDKDNNAIKLAAIKEAAKTNGTIKKAFDDAVGGGDSTTKSKWSFGVKVAAATRPDITPRVYKNDQAYVDPGFTDPIFQPKNEQTAKMWFATPEISLFARYDLGEGMNLHLQGSYNWADYKLKLGDNRRDTIADITHNRLAFGATLLFNKKLSDIFTIAGGPGVSAGWDWVSTKEPYKDVSLGNGLVMEGTDAEPTSNLALGVGGTVEVQAKISEGWSALLSFELEARARFATPYTFQISPTQSGELRFDPSSPFTSRFGAALLYRF